MNSTEDDNKSDSFEEPSSDESDFDFDDESSNQSYMKSQTPQTSQALPEKAVTFDNKVIQQECDSRTEECISTSVETYDNYLGDETGKSLALIQFMFELQTCLFITDASDTDHFIRFADAKARIQLRLPSGDRHIFEWPCTTKLKALKLYIPFKYPELTSDPYKVICPFVSGQSNNILDMDDGLTLKEANLYPTVILHLRNED